MTLLSELQGAAGFGRPELALFALDRLSELARDDQERENIRRQRERLEDRLFDEIEVEGARAEPATDLVRFLRAWTAGNADYNHDGVTDLSDLVQYLTDWTAKQ